MACEAAGNAAMTVRVAAPDDAPAIAAVHVSAWQQAYRGLLPQEGLDQLSVDKRTALWQKNLSGDASTTAVHEREGSVDGFVCYGACRDDDVTSDMIGEIIGINVAPSAWGTGAGRDLCRHARSALVAGGDREVCLWVLAGNARACRFYDKEGFTPDGTEREVEILGRLVREIRYRWSVASR